MQSTGANLENTSLSWLDRLTSIENDTVKQQNRIVATGIEQMLTELRKSYTKIVDTEGKSNNWTAQQLANRIENSLELLPPAQRKQLETVYNNELARAQELGRNAGLDLDKTLKNRDEALKKNARPNTDAMKASGRRLREFWADENSLMTDRVKALTREAAMQGKSWRSLAGQIRQLLVAEQKQGTESARSRRVNKQMGLAQRAEVIAKTELATSYIQGKIDNYRSMGYDFVRWSAAAERTCGYCMSRDGLIYQIDEVENSIPAHPRCRCSLVPVEAESLRKPKGPNGPDAAEQLDDTYWTKSRNDKLAQWKQENRGIRDPKTESILNDMLRNYAKTPTNAEKYLKGPNAKAVEPRWAPSGDVIPSLPKAEANAEKALERETKAAEKRYLKEQEEIAKKAAKEEEERLAAQRRKEAEEQARIAEEKAEKAAAEAAAAMKKAQKLQKADAKKKADAAKKQPGTKAEQEAALVKQAQDEIKKLSQKALGGTFTAADKAALAKWKKQRDDILNRDKPVEKIDAKTKNIDWEYDPREWQSYGYKSKAAMEDALGDLRLWTGTEYMQVRAQQLANASPKRLNAYEKGLAKDMKFSTDNDMLVFGADEYTKMAKNLETLVKASPKYDGKIHRGMNVPTVKDAEAVIKEIADGKVSNTLESWSNSKFQADKFTYTSAQGTAAEGKAGINFTVVNKNGSPVASASEFGSENEVLVPSGQKYKVKKVTRRVKEAPWRKGENYDIFDVVLELI